MLIIGGFGSGKTNVLLNLIRQKDSDVLNDKINLCTEDLNEPKYELLIKKREEVGMSLDPNPKAFIEYVNTVDNVHNNIDNYNPRRKQEITIVFDNLIADINNNKKFKP